jgi:hypothetical protein
VNVLSQPMLVVSVGPRPANSRPANSTREYEPGSGESHDPAPVHHPHPARSPPAVVSLPSGCAGAYGAAPPASRVLRIADATDLRPALDPGASTTPGAANNGQAKDLPRRIGAPQGQGHHSLPDGAPRSSITKGRPQQTPAQNRTGQQEKPQHQTRKRTKNIPRLDMPFHMNIPVIAGHRARCRTPVRPVRCRK